METPDFTKINVEKIAEMFPNVMTEAQDEQGNLVRKIDFEKLKQELSSNIIDGDESYDFTWVGKKQAMIEANKPINKTLRPCREDSLNWENTENLYIEGDNLEVLKLLQESYLNKVKMIYIDPPYNTGNDSFIYPDDYATNKDKYDEEVGAIDESGYRMFKNTETNGRFHSSWCSMMYPRLKLARNLLSEDGVIFISMADSELTNLTKICEEVFGKGNIEIFVWKKKGGAGNTEKIIGILTEYIVCCFKNKKPNDLNYQKIDRQYKYCDDLGVYNLEGIEKTNLGMYERQTMLFGIKDPKTEEIFYPSNGMRWTIGEETVQNLIKEGKLYFDYSSKKVKRIKRKEDYENAQNVYYNLFVDEGSLAVAKDECFELLQNREIFDTPKPIKLLNKLLNIASKKDSIVLDFFSGSATTAHAVIQLNAEDGGQRKFIMVQLPEVCDEKSEAKKAGFDNICEIGKERIRRAGKKIVEETGKTDLDIGFRVFKLDESNMKEVYYKPDDYNQSMLEKMTSNIKEDRTPEDLLYACMLDWGLELSLPHSVEKIDGFDVHIVNDGDLIACFDEKISEDAIKQIADKKPLRVVFRDSSFANDAARVNVGEIFKLKSPNTTVKVI